MSPRLARWFATALVAFLFAQPIPFQAFAADSSDAPCCCKVKSASCCRRSQHTSGPQFSSRDCCGQCQVSVRQSQPVGEMAAFAKSSVELAPTISQVIARRDGFRITHSDSALYQRPPPSVG